MTADGISRPEPLKTDMTVRVYLASLPLVHIEKIADGWPQPFFANPARPLDGVRALGFSHVIAGPGMGRAFAYHGADVLNIWEPTSFEMDFNYYTANVGMRSATLDLSHPEGIGRLRRTRLAGGRVLRQPTPWPDREAGPVNG